MPFKFSRSAYSMLRPAADSGGPGQGAVLRAKLLPLRNRKHRRFVDELHVNKHSPTEKVLARLFCRPNNI